MAGRGPGGGAVTSREQRHLSRGLGSARFLFSRGGRCGGARGSGAAAGQCPPATRAAAAAVRGGRGARPGVTASNRE